MQVNRLLCGEGELLSVHFKSFAHFQWGKKIRFYKGLKITGQDIGSKCQTGGMRTLK